MINKDTLMDIKNNLDEYYENSLSIEEIINIDNKLNLFPIEDEILDKNDILKYACLIRNEIKEYVSNNTNVLTKPNYIKYNTSIYSVLRTLSNINEIYSAQKIEDNILENQVKTIEYSIDLELNRKRKQYLLK